METGPTTGRTDDVAEHRADLAAARQSSLVRDTSPRPRCCSTRSVVLTRGRAPDDVVAAERCAPHDVVAVGGRAPDDVVAVGHRAPHDVVAVGAAAVGAPHDVVAVAGRAPDDVVAVEVTCPRRRCRRPAVPQTTLSPSPTCPRRRCRRRPSCPRRRCRRRQALSVFAMPQTTFVAHAFAVGEITPPVRRWLPQMIGLLHTAGQRQDTRRPAWPFA